jgi:8-oxo-dGTP pyrophosphatase MutT (NUDIX family)
MASVYAAVCDEDGRYLIATKRFENRWWGKSLTHEVQDKRSGKVQTVENKNELVHQASQWAFPGGWLEDDESPNGGALREFREETGIDLAKDFKPKIDLKLFRADTTGCYYLVRYLVSKSQLDQINLAASANIKEDPTNHEKPVGSSVVDWELKSLEIVGSDDLWNYLGVRQLLPDALYKKITEEYTDRSGQLRRRLMSTQLIDWFRWMAIQLMNAPIAQPVSSPWDPQSHAPALQAAETDQ